MSELPISEEFLYTHISRADQAMVETLPEESELKHSFFNGFLNKMNALIKRERRRSVGRFAGRFF